MGVVLLAAGCAQPVPPPAQISWQYGTGNGEGSKYQGPAPIYKRAYGMGNGESVTSGLPATTRYGYGAEGMAGNVVKTDTAPPTMTAQPATKPGSSS
jgi:hypothetical protein